MAKLMTDRTENDIKNKWNSMKRAKKRADDKLTRKALAISLKPEKGASKRVGPSGRGKRKRVSDATSAPPNSPAIPRLSTKAAPGILSDIGNSASLTNQPSAGQQLNQKGHETNAAFGVPNDENNVDIQGVPHAASSRTPPLGFRNFTSV